MCSPWCFCSAHRCTHKYIHINYIYIYIYMCVYIYIYIYYTHTYIHTYIHTYMHTHMYIYICICICICIRICICICICIYTYLYTYTHICTHTICRDTGVSHPCCALVGILHSPRVPYHVGITRKKHGVLNQIALSECVSRNQIGRAASCTIRVQSPDPDPTSLGGGTPMGPPCRSKESKGGTDQAEEEAASWARLQYAEGASCLNGPTFLHV